MIFDFKYLHYKNDTGMNLIVVSCQCDIVYSEPGDPSGFNFFKFLYLKILVLWFLYLLTLEKTSSYLFISHLKPVLCLWTSDGLEGQSSFISIWTGWRVQIMIMRTEWVCPSRSWREEMFLWLWEMFKSQIQENTHAKSIMVMYVRRQQQFTYKWEVK